MSFVHRTVSGYDLIDLKESLDLYSVPDLKNLCFELLKKPSTKRIMFVMNELEYIDSSGIGMLLNLAHECKISHLGFKLINLSPSIRKIFAYANALEAFDIYETEKEAIESNVRSTAYRHKVINGIDLVIFEGAIDLYSAPEIKKFCRNLFKKGNKKIIFSFAKVDYLDSSCLGMLTNLHFESKQENIKFKLSNLSNSCKEIFSLTKMDLTFDIYNTIEEAVESMNQP